jgi:tetratricopeptide (TPR) repeat protein
MAAGRIDDAIQTYERAIHFTHVREGPNNLAQVPLANGLSEAYYELGDIRRANRIHDQIFLLQERTLDSDEQMLDALQMRARWAKRIDDLETAIKSYRRMIRILDEENVEDDPRLIEPLMDLALISAQQALDSYARWRELLKQQAQRAMRRAVLIARETGEENPELLARTLVDQADRLLVMNMRRLANASYREAWSLLDAEPDLRAVRSSLFSEPVRIYSARMDRVYDKPEEGVLDLRTYPGEGYVEVRYAVNEHGRAADIEITDSEPAGLLDSHVYQKLRTHVYRPYYRDGEPTAREGLTLRHEFGYDESRFSDRERAFIERSRIDRETAAAATTSGG